MGEQKKASERTKKWKKTGFLCVVLLWTGFVAAGVFVYRDTISKLEQKVNTFMSEVALSKTAISKRSAGKKKKQGMKGTLAYVVENEDTLAQVEEENLVRLVSVFPGKSIENLFWSSAATKKANEMSFYTSEDKSSENTSLFQNGSSDITVWNASKQDKSVSKKETKEDSVSKGVQSNLKMIEKLEKTYSRSYLMKNFYIVDSSTSIDNQIFQVKTLLTMNLKMKKKKEPQILIFHTHGASESFADSRKGKTEDSIIGIGELLAKELSNTYGYEVLHDKTPYDKIDGKIDRNRAYNQAYTGLCKTLEKHPGIQVIIDLHRDGVGMKVDRTTVIDGKRTAQPMFFNGLSRNASGDIEYLKNENLQANLAFSLQLKMASLKRYEDFARPVYLKSYRYNMHLRKRFTLIELGNENNTVEEAQNAVKPLAAVINDVLAK